MLYCALQKRMYALATTVKLATVSYGSKLVMGSLSTTIYPCNLQL
jgi:hypothetical protein